MSDDNYTEEDFIRDFTRLVDKLSIINQIKTMKLKDLKKLRKRIDEEIAKRSEQE